MIKLSHGQLSDCCTIFFDLLGYHVLFSCVMIHGCTLDIHLCLHLLLHLSNIIDPCEQQIKLFHDLIHELLLIICTLGHGV